MQQNPPSLISQCMAEFIGTFILVFLGNTAIAVAVFAGAYDLAGVALMWGMGVVLAVYVVGAISGAHLNPAVSMAMAALGKMPAGRLAPYAISQVAGAFTAAVTIYLGWSGMFAAAAAKEGLEVGAAGSQKLMMIFSCFYPNPAMFGTDQAAFARVSTGSAFLLEVVMTALLVIVILAVTNERNSLAPKSNLAPYFIGLTVMTMVGIGAPATMTSINPARDFGPRLFGWLIGYGDIAFPGPRGNEWWLYIVAPIIGALLGALIYQKGVNRFLSENGS